MKFLVINGPNLNMMHFTEPGVAGQLDYNGLLDYLELCCTQMGLEVEFFQSNHEGDPTMKPRIARIFFSFLHFRAAPSACRPDCIQD